MKLVLNKHGPPGFIIKVPLFGIQKSTGFAKTNMFIIEYKTEKTYQRYKHERGTFVE